MAYNKKSYKTRVSYHTLLGKEKAKVSEILGIGGVREAEKEAHEYKLEELENIKETGTTAIELGHTLMQIGADKQFKDEEVPAVAERLAKADYESSMYQEWKTSNKDVKIQDQTPFESDWTNYKSTDIGQDLISKYTPEISGKLSGILPGGKKWDYGRRVLGDPSYTFGETSLKKSQISAMYQKIEAENLLDVMDTQSKTGAGRHKRMESKEKTPEKKTGRVKSFFQKYTDKTVLKEDSPKLSNKEFMPEGSYNRKPFKVGDTTYRLDKNGQIIQTIPDPLELPPPTEGYKLSDKAIDLYNKRYKKFEDNPASRPDKPMPQETKPTLPPMTNMMEEIRKTAGFKEIDIKQNEFEYTQGIASQATVGEGYDSAVSGGEGYLPYKGSKAQNIDILQYAVGEKTPDAFNFSFSDAQKGKYDQVTVRAWNSEVKGDERQGVYHMPEYPMNTWLPEEAGKNRVLSGAMTIRGFNENLEKLAIDDPKEFASRGIPLDYPDINLKGKNVSQMWEDLGFGKWDETAVKRQDLLTKMHNPGSYYAPNPKMWKGLDDKDKLSNILASTK